MALSDPKAFGAPARRLRNVSKSTQHVVLAVPAGDVLDVTADVGAQLEAASTSFVEVGTDREKAATAGLVEIAAAGEPEAVEVKAEPVKAAPTSFVEVGTDREKAATAGLVEIAAAGEPEAVEVKAEPVKAAPTRSAARKAARSAK